MVYEPQLPEVKRHIDHYWILNSADLLTLNSTHMYAYPGITPDMIIVLEGHYSLSYQGENFRSNRSLLFSFIHEKVHIDFSALKRCIVVKFKSRALSSLKPFIRVGADIIMKNSVAFTEDVFGIGMQKLNDYLKTCVPELLVCTLDSWFAQRYRKEGEGFIVEMSQEVSTDCDLSTIMHTTGYSYSTLERYFKKETGLTPKAFQTLQRFKKVLRELSTTKNQDWQHYVLQYGYYDQSHFIKEMKRFTGNTPSALVQMPSFIKLRPHYS
ncbi:helix-turn-helix domain-containing protein [Flagellimonas sp. HMM57]|uniref:helix-turn-helix domain-containing protein n=1 Tax=unclassified Flagellimonas TaxID=2644544 RepID=UPI0013D02F34|nr:MULTISPECIES: helix-turn-helix domain-containing protein [unclassified Flagellimonas]UII74664.1 helix-turn-helix domain-containing protein [Flagellimonas sp. HMM57]